MAPSQPCPEPMRILNIIQCSNLGGMEQASLRLMEALQRRGHALSVVSLHPLGPLAPALLASSIPALGLGYGQVPLWRWLRRLRRELRRQAPDALLLTGHSLPALLAIAGGCHGRLVLAIHFHHTGVKPRWFWWLFYAIATRQFRAITFPSHFVRREAIALYPPLATRARTVRNPLTPPALITPAARLQARRELGLSPEGPVVGNGGWLIPRKRFDVFLQVAARVLAHQPQVRFVIAGDGPEAASLKTLARELGIERSVHWLGWQVSMEPVYAALDLLLFHSDWDAMGLTPIEAMARGLPVVASVLHGGLREVASTPAVAVVLEQHDPEALASHVLRLLSDPAAAAALGSRGRRQVLALSDSEAIASWHERALADPAPLVPPADPLP